MWHARKYPDCKTWTVYDDAGGGTIASKMTEENAQRIAALGSISEIEWQAIYDALAFTAKHSPIVSNAHNRAVDHVCKILGKPIEPNP